ncbi:MAG: hypothetical protein AB7F43_14650 [Bacteriovoracia bacterium]
MTQSPSPKPVLIPSDQKRLAYSFSEVTQGKKLTYSLNKSERQHVESLIKALKSGDKKSAYKLSKGFYEEILDPLKVTAAYFQVFDLHLPDNASFRIVMDWLKDRYGRIKPAYLPVLPLDEAIVLLVLAVTQTDKESISYKRTQLVNGKEQECSTSYPLKEAVIKDFIAPFGHIDGILEKSVIFHNNVVIGNPAIAVAQIHAKERERYEGELAVWEEATKQQEMAIVKQTEQAAKKAKTVVLNKLTALEDQLLALCETEEQYNATQYVLSSAINTLSVYTDAPADAFLKRLENVYKEKLNPAQSRRLAERMYVALQSLLKELHRMTGKNWLKSWIEAQNIKGKQHRTFLDFKAKTAHDLIAWEEGRDAVRLDKNAGDAKMAEFYAQSSSEVNNPYAPSRELTKVFADLKVPANIQGLIKFAFKEEEFHSSHYPQLIEKVFRAYPYPDYDIPVIKANFLKDVGGKEAPVLWLDLEAVAMRISSLYKRQRLDILAALEVLRKEDAEAKKRKRNKSPWEKYGGGDTAV